MARSTLLILALLATTGCSRNDPTIGPPIAPRKAAVRDACDGKCCWGMHEYNVPTQCENCGADGLAASHRLCKKCAASAKACPHCRGKLPESSTPETKQEETPAPAPTPQPPPPPPQDPPPPPKAQSSQNLMVEPVDLSQGVRKSHSVIAFAAESEHADSALARHRTHKPELIRQLPDPKAGRDAGLYLVWGHYPVPNITAAGLKAELDPNTRRIKVTVPPLKSRLPGSGIGMDWGKDDNPSRMFVGFRAKLSTLPAGDYAFEVIEEDTDGKGPRTLAEGTFTLTK